MKTKSFDYTKSSGEVSRRKVIVLQPAKDYDHVIDISEVSLPHTEEILAVELQKIHADYMNSLKELLTEFGLEKNIRNFKINRMSDVTEEEI